MVYEVSYVVPPVLLFTFLIEQLLQGKNPYLRSVRKFGEDVTGADPSVRPRILCARNQEFNKFSNQNRRWKLLSIVLNDAGKNAIGLDERARYFYTQALVSAGSRPLRSIALSESCLTPRFEYNSKRS